MSDKMVKITLNMPEHILKRVDDTANKLGMNRTSLINLCVSGWLGTLDDALNPTVRTLQALYDEYSQEELDALVEHYRKTGSRVPDDE